VQEPKGAYPNVIFRDSLRLTSVSQVRCSLEKPICKRCTRLKHDCTYATNNTKSKFVDRSARRQLAVRAPGETLEHVSRIRNVRPDSPVPGISSGISKCNNFRTAKTAIEIPPDLLLTLVNVYYDCVYNASLLLHRRTFMQALSAGTMPRHVILSVCAFAAK
jgi:hypothetical protein